MRLHVRDRFAEATIKSAQQWPVENTAYEKLFLDGARLTRELPKAGETAYDPLDYDAQATFDLRFDAETELVGHMKLKLFVSTDEGDDLDLFVSVEKMRTDGSKEGFAHWAVYTDGPVALGWLRVSRRRLDPKKSTEHQPVLANTHEDKVAPGEVVEADIEILPSGTRFFRGRNIAPDHQGARHLQSPEADVLFAPRRYGESRDAPHSYRRRQRFLSICSYYEIKCRQVSGHISFF